MTADEPTAAARPPLLTVGHGTLTAAALTSLLAGAGVQLLVDVRRFPASRTHPDLAAASLDTVLPAAGVAYRWDERLGGRRRLPAGTTAEDRWWSVDPFRAYAAHTRTPEFRAALDDLLAAAATRRAAVLCSETVWWRCHRRLIADVVVVTGRATVTHLGHDGRSAPHRPADGARLRPDGLVVWDGAPPV